jgi:hypothetical protein
MMASDADMSLLYAQRFEFLEGSIRFLGQVFNH